MTYLYAVACVATPADTEEGLADTAEQVIEHFSVYCNPAYRLNCRTRRPTQDEYAALMAAVRAALAARQREFIRDYCGEYIEINAS